MDAYNETNTTTTIHAARDINVDGDFTVTFQSSDRAFYEPPLDRYDGSKSGRPRPEPNIKSYLPLIAGTGQGRGSRLLLFGGYYPYKQELARYFGWALRDWLTIEQQHSVYLREWTGEVEGPPLLATIEDTHDPTVFVFPSLHPYAIKHDLPALIRVLGERHHAVITTETPRELWSIKDQDDTWQEPPIDSSLYDADALISYLKSGLGTYFIGTQRELLETAELLEKDFLTQLAVALGHPDRIDTFITTLKASVEKGEVFEHQGLKELALTLADSKTGDKEVLERWFRYSLTSSEQLLVIGLSLLPRLYEDQFFAALEEIINKSWRKRDQALAFPDYLDLAQLHNYFRVRDTGGLARIEPVETDIPSLILEVAWSTHRRLIDAALGVLVDLTHRSVEADAKLRQPDLFRDREQRWLFRQVVSETLGIIASLSKRHFEKEAVRLAAHEHPGVQAVAARAFAHWHERNPGVAPYTILRHWQEETWYFKYVEYLSEALGNKAITPSSQIGATLAYTLGELAKQSPPGQLPKPLYELFRELSSDSDSKVVRAFIFGALPVIASLHLDIVVADIHRLMALPGFSEDIAIALSWVFNYQPLRITELLNEWSDNALNEQRTSLDENDLTQREIRLTTVVLTYGDIVAGIQRYNNFSLPITPKIGFDRITSILKAESHPWVREMALKAVTKLCDRHFDTIDKEFRTLVPALTKPERNHIVAFLYDIFLKQRRQLKGGDATFDQGGATYQLWLYSDTPKTRIEEAMIEWTSTDHDITVMQLGYDAETSFREKFERAAETREAELREARDFQEGQDKVPESLGFDSDLDKGYEKLTFIQKYFAIPLGTIGKDRELRWKVSALLPKVLVQDVSTRREMMTKYHRTNRGEIADALQNTVWITQNIYWLVPVLVLFVVLFLAAVF